MDFYITTPYIFTLWFYDSLKPEIYFPCEFVSLSFSVFILSLINSPVADERLPLDFAFVWTLRRSRTTHTTSSKETTYSSWMARCCRMPQLREVTAGVTAAWKQCITGANQTDWVCDAVYIILSAWPSLHFLTQTHSTTFLGFLTCATLAQQYGLNLSFPGQYATFPPKNLFKKSLQSIPFL